MSSYSPTDDADTLEVPALAMTQAQAAEALAISERTLRTWTRQGRVPHVQMGRMVRYPTDRLLAWLEAQTKGGTDAIGTP
ncbi:MAG: helix-turn-helix domain-containing protein [Phycisphaerales bacterium]